MLDNGKRSRLDMPISSIHWRYTREELFCLRATAVGSHLYLPSNVAQRCLDLGVCRLRRRGKRAGRLVKLRSSVPQLVCDECKNETGKFPGIISDYRSKHSSVPTIFNYGRSADVLRLPVLQCNQREVNEPVILSFRRAEPLNADRPATVSDVSTQYTSSSAASCDTRPIPTITTNCDRRRRRRQLYDKNSINIVFAVFKIFL